MERFFTKIWEQTTRLGQLLQHSSSARWALLFLILPLFSGSAMGFWAISQTEVLHSFSVVSWVILFLLLAVPIALSIIPNTLAGLLAGYFLGFGGFPAMVLSFTLASVMGFFVGKKLDSGIREAVFNLWPSSRKTFENLKRESLWTVIFLRLSPAPPFAVGSLLLSWIQVPFGRFLAGSLLGMFPRMALVVGIGAHAVQFAEIMKNPGQSAELRWSSLLFLIVAGAGFFWLKRKIRQKEN